MRQVYVNGRFAPETEAKISVFDRGFLFADAVYEVTLVLLRQRRKHQKRKQSLRPRRRPEGVARFLRHAAQAGVA